MKNFIIFTIATVAVVALIVVGATWYDNYQKKISNQEQDLTNTSWTLVSANMPQWQSEVSQGQMMIQAETDSLAMMSESTEESEFEQKLMMVEDSTDGGELMESTVEPNLVEENPFAGMSTEEIFATIGLTINFDGEKASGFNGCNNFFMNYEAKNGSISFGQAGQTMMACNGLVMSLEQAYMSALQTSDTYYMTEDSLELWSGGELTLKYTVAKTK